MSKTMSVELVEALKAAGMEIMPKVELTVEEKVAKIFELRAVHKVALEAKDEKTAKKVRRQLRKLGFKLSEWKKQEAEI